MAVPGLNLFCLVHLRSTSERWTQKRLDLSMSSVTRTPMTEPLSSAFAAGSSPKRPKTPPQDFSPAPKNPPRPPGGGGGEGKRGDPRVREKGGAGGRGELFFPPPP